MKGKSLIEPGYNSGSKLCDGCKKLEYRGSATLCYCLEFDYIKLELHPSRNALIRCEECLESEVKQ